MGIFLFLFVYLCPCGAVTVKKGGGLMKKNYLIGGDLFIASAFVTFIIGAVLYLLGIRVILWNITPVMLVKLSYWCLLFSIALSLIETAKKS